MTSKIIDEFIHQMCQVATLQEWLTNIVGHLRVSIASGEADARLVVMAEYLEKQAANLSAFVKGLENPPKLDGAAAQPVVNVKPVDPSVN